MIESFFLSNLIAGSASSAALLALLIVVGVIFLEDTTVVVVGMLAADGLLSIPFALFSLYVGVVIGDIALYSLGRLARTHPRLAHYVDHDFTAPFRIWLETRFVLTVFSARFIPGARLPAYTASGFFHSPLSVFLFTTIGATAIWTTFLFSASYLFGNLTAGWMGPARWGIALGFLIALFLIGRHNVLSYRARRDGADTCADTRAPSAEGE
ncbi:MAG: VTT domain-containing protein [Candidatus Paceibacterota bacterium]|jgi:membrane protein DedA with SNARE-associated domain